MSDKTNPLIAFLKRIWWAANLFRKLVMIGVAAMIVLFALILLGAIAGSEGPVVVPERAALVLDPNGMVVEQLSGEPFDRALAELLDSGEAETLLRDLLDAMEVAKDDDRIEVLVLSLDRLIGLGPSKLGDLKRGIEEFKATGKKVIATADFYDRNRYYLASLADEVHLHPMGMVILDGYGRYRTYYKEGIDKFGLEWHVFRVGEFKSATEPYLRSDMSPEARTANVEWLGDLWRHWLADVADARGLTPEGLSAGIENLPAELEAAGGDTAKLALDRGLVDHLSTRGQVRQRLIELVGEDEDNHTFNQIHHADYLEALGTDRPDWGGDGGDDEIAVIIARGTIVGGSQPPGTIGGESTAKLIRDARLDDDVKAIVLRVDSGGGSAFASDVIRNEFILAREAGKKVVISMGSVAASGGYWIASASDEIWASPTTITGSIGIFGMFPTYHKPMREYLGWNVDGVGTTWLAGAIRPDRPLDPRLGQVIQTSIEQGYEEFISRVAEAREMTVEEVDAIGRGRVWSGEDAHELGLVDNLGGLEDAIASAAALAELGDDYGVRFIEKELDFSEQLMIDMMSGFAERFGPSLGRAVGRPAFHELFTDHLARHAELLTSMDDPHGMYAHCLCEVE